MSSDTCSICFEKYSHTLNPPMLCNPCGHNICKPCIETWLQNSQTCPLCRNHVSSITINRDLLNYMVENSIPSAPPAPLDYFKFYETLEKKNELILDKSLYSVNIIDNSLSMTESDGKLFEFTDSGKLIKKSGIWRWEEAVYKIIYIADYNIKRGMKSTYYLLNPKRNSKLTSNLNIWQENIDYVTIDPTQPDINEKLNILKKTILDTKNIRGNTPLDIITDYFIKSLREFINDDMYNQIPICYNILTDGNPNSRYSFENKLKELCKNYNVFLVINLCTDNDDIIDYYNNLDKTLGNELSGMDVIDDLETEQLEIINSKNTFFTYSHDIHVCRMAGCYSVVADLLDEEPLKMFYVLKLCKELIHCPKDLPHWENRVDYIKSLKKHNTKVYNFYEQKFTPLINTNYINNMIFQYQMKECIIRLHNRYYLSIYGLLFLIFYAFVSSFLV
uniref:RING-type domain-containing protein n=1 Tax=viral metagenome TaxID=1070528 RepID=A0A6C0J019_9ZZZZ